MKLHFPERRETEESVLWCGKMSLVLKLSWAVTSYPVSFGNFRFDTYLPVEATLLLFPNHPKLDFLCDLPLSLHKFISRLPGRQISRKHDRIYSFPWAYEICIRYIIFPLPREMQSSCTLCGSFVTQGTSTWALHCPRRSADYTPALAAI